MKGTLSEMELSTFRQRSVEALRAKARRGELLTTVAIGYIRSSDDRIELDPDRVSARPLSWFSRNFARSAASVRYCCGCGRRASSCPYGRSARRGGE